MASRPPLECSWAAIADRSTSCAHWAEHRVHVTCPSDRSARSRPVGPDEPERAAAGEAFAPWLTKHAESQSLYILAVTQRGASSRRPSARLCSGRCVRTRLASVGLGRARAYTKWFRFRHASNHLQTKCSPVWLPSCAELRAPNFAAGRFWEVADEVDDSRILVGSRLGLDVFLEFAHKVV